MELFEAHRQWASRPDDERYPTLQALHQATVRHASAAVERPEVPLNTLSVVADKGEVALVGRGNIPARLSHWGFGQLAKFAGAPANYLRQLPAGLAVDNLTHGLKERDQDQTVNLLVHQGNGLLIRAFTSDRYARIWNYEVAERLLGMATKGWVPATPTFNSLNDNKSTALYASDHDMFAFICHPDRVIRESGNDKGLLRGLIAVNSDVGASKLRLLQFLYREMCGNHIIWGAEDVAEFAVAHVGNIRDQLQSWDVEVRKYLDSSPSDEEAKVEQSKRKLIAATKEQVLDTLFGKRSLQLSRKLLTAAYDAVNPDQDGDARSYWGMAQGLTRHSQTIPYADERTKVDVAAGKVLAMAF